MNQKNQYRLSIGLMAAGLGLLVVFLSIWLKSVYREEYQTLQKSTTQAFLTSIMGIQNEILDELYIRPNVFAWRDTTKIQHKAIRLRTENGYFEKRTTTTPQDSTFFISINAKAGPGIKDNMSGALSLIVAMETDSLCIDALADHGPGLMVFDKVNDRLEQTMAASQWPVEYRLVRFNDSLPIHQPAFISGKYLDTLTGDSYAVELSAYKPYLVKQMTPEILFALLLLLVITAAFRMIYLNLRNQQRLTELKNDFISNVTHELKTPITTVSVAIEAMSSFNVLKSPERTQEYLDISRLELQRLSILVDKVLKMSRFEQGGIDLNPENLDLKNLVEEILLSLKLQFERRQAKVAFRTDSADVVQLQGDRTHLTSVVYNLLDNALKYSPEKPDIEVLLEEEEDSVSLVISDKGIGIPKEYQDKIFDKFFRAPTGDVHNTKGHGLGLSYVAKVIREHRGQIKVESKPGSGACFTIQLPKMYAAG